MSVMLTKKMERGARELESFISKAKRKLFEFEVARSEWELKTGQGTIHKSAASLMRHIKSLRKS